MSDSYFDGLDELDSAFLNEVDVIEATQLSRPNPPSPSVAQPNPKAAPPNPKPQPTAPSSDDFDMTFDVDAEELDRLDEFIADAYAGKAKPVAGPSLTRQTTLDGNILPVDKPKQGAPRSQSMSKPSTSAAFGNNRKKTKQWDHTAFSETGWRSTKKAAAAGKAKGKGKAKEVDADEDEDEDEPVEFEQFPAPFVSGIPPSPMKLKPDLLAARTWIYPLNRPRRDYQFNIARQCLFQNTLVALPTGLGKTFIAGVVMLNYYKWFPEGRIIFTAPTKPLVAQQIEACHQVCGIPGSDAVELTGEMKPSKRSIAWTEKRVMYMTPQTLVMDFQSGNVDPQDIALIVFDEAHRGTGDYAYAQIMRFMMSKNPHFRVLALTATPGNNAEAVQAIVDSLHISHIEIRNEESQDLYQYVLKKVVETHIIKMSDSLKRVCGLLSKVIEPLLNRVRGAGLVHQQSPVMLHSFACQVATRDVAKRKDLGWAFGYLKVLGSLARAMAYLMETSIRSSYRQLMELQDILSSSDKPSDKIMTNLLKSDKNWVALLAELEKQKAHGFDPHPKMEKLISLTLKHFVEADAEAAAARLRGEKMEGESKVMVFVQFRDCVDEIIDRLKYHEPLIRPTPFVGQGTDKRGKKGITQKEQLKTIEKFKAGEFNVLVSTSIGEEGLDIGEIDEIICYDAQKSSVRMLQRVGRTGRKRQGKVDVLLAEQREERNWQKSKDNYEDVQYTIISGNQLELYDDVDRLVPGSPQCLLTEMPIELYVRSPQKEKKTKEAPVRKRKRNDDINRNVPLGALTGFLPASALQPKPKRKRAKAAVNDNMESDSDDAAIAAGLGGATSNTTRKAKARKPRAEGAKAYKARKAGKDATASQSKLDLFLVPDHLQDDDDDLDIQIGLQDIINSPTKSRVKKESDDSDVDVSPTRAVKARRKRVTASDDEDDPLHRPLASKVKGRRKKTVEAGPSRKPAPSWLLQGSSDGEPEARAKSSLPKSSVTNAKPNVSSKPTSLFRSAKTQLEQPQSDSLYNDMPMSPEEPQPTFAIRPPVKGRRVQLPPSSPHEGEEQPAPRRITRRRTPSPTNPISKNTSKKKRAARVPINPAVFDTEAIHSGDEVSEGTSDVDMVESESDRRFLQEPGQTQIPLSYNQTAAYRMGLMTQVPDQTDGPRFATKPKRVGRFAGGRTQVPRPPGFDSSPQRNEEPDEYHMGSFVVKDDDEDEDIMYSNSSEP